MDFQEIKKIYNIKQKKILKDFNIYQNKYNSCQGGDFYLWGYDKIYEKYLNKFKNKKVAICEIGILEGYKLFILSNYFLKIANYMDLILIFLTLNILIMIFEIKLRK